MFNFFKKKKQVEEKKEYRQHPYFRTDVLFRDEEPKVKNKSSVPWRNDYGVIECNHDCPQGCDDSCPIHCMHNAIENFIMLEDVPEAIRLLKKAIAIASDYAEAWNVLGSVYGQCDDHLAAYKAYKTAHSINEHHQKALFGLMCAAKNLGRLDEAMDYCYEYGDKFGMDTNAEEIRDEIALLKLSPNPTKIKTDVEIVEEIVKHAREIGLLGNNERLPWIHELFIEAQNVCQKVHFAMVSDKDEPSSLNPVIWNTGCAYAGMGAVQLWHENWNSLKAKGIAETLLEPKGVWDMDEYVIDIIGIGWGTSESNKFSDSIAELAHWTFIHFMCTKDDKKAWLLAQQSMKAMYYFGMVLQMERLGMK